MLEIRKTDVKKVLKNIVNQDDIPQKHFSEIKTIINKTFEYAAFELDMEVIEVRELTSSYRPPTSRFRKQPKKEQVFYIDEIAKLEEVCMQENTLMSLGLLLTLNTGLRVGEISALEIKDIHENHIEIRQAKITCKDWEVKRHTELALPKENKIEEVTLSNEAKFFVKKYWHFIQPVKVFLF